MVTAFDSKDGSDLHQQTLIVGRFPTKHNATPPSRASPPGQSVSSFKQCFSAIVEKAPSTLPGGAYQKASTTLN
jgi:hypothetical protein